MYCRAWLARYSDATCADHSVVLPWWCSASAVAPSAMPRLCQGKESTCLAFFLHLCSHGLLDGGTEGPQFSCKRNVWCSSGGGGWMGEGWRVQNVFTPALLITMQEKPVALVFCSVLWKHSVKQLKLLSLGLFLLAKLDWDEERAEHSLSVKLPKPSTHPIAPECKRERCWHPLQSLPLNCVRWHPVPSWVPAAVYCFVSPETVPVVGDTVPTWALILHWSISTGASFER